MNYKTHKNPLPLFVDGIMLSAFLEVHKWQEYHKNGQIWIDGQIGIVPEESKNLYGLIRLEGHEGELTVRIGVWSKYYDNGQLAWQLDYRDGMNDSKIKKQKFRSYRKDGTAIIYNDV